jgi:hypothetical protein
MVRALPWHPENDGGVRHCGGGWTSRRDLRGPQIRGEHLVPDPIRRHPPLDQRHAWRINGNGPHVKTWTSSGSGTSLRSM